MMTELRCEPIRWTHPSLSKFRDYYQAKWGIRPSEHADKIWIGAFDGDQLAGALCYVDYHNERTIFEVLVSDSFKHPIAAHSLLNWMLSQTPAGYKVFGWVQIQNVGQQKVLEQMGMKATAVVYAREI